MSKVDTWRALPHTRADAIAAGTRYFFPEEPCARGHIAPRQLRLDAPGFSGCTRCMFIGHPRLAERVPPWQSDEEMDDIVDFYVNRPEGFQVDHVIPLNHRARATSPLVIGLHVRPNLQYLSGHDNLVKGLRSPRAHHEARQAVWDGLAVWARHVDGVGRVDWKWYRPVKYRSAVIEPSPLAAAH